MVRMLCCGMVWVLNTNLTILKLCTWSTYTCYACNTHTNYVPSFIILWMCHCYMLHMTRNECTISATYSPSSWFKWCLNLSPFQMFPINSPKECMVLHFVRIWQSLSRILLSETENKDREFTCLYFTQCSFAAHKIWKSVNKLPITEFCCSI